MICVYAGTLTCKFLFGQRYRVNHSTVINVTAWENQIYIKSFSLISILLVGGFFTFSEYKFGIVYVRNRHIKSSNYSS